MKQGNIEGYMICLYQLIIFYMSTTEIRKSFRSETDWLCLGEKSSGLPEKYFIIKQLHNRSLPSPLLGKGLFSS